MYVLDTNVLSEIIKETPEAAVAEWLKSCRLDWVFTTVICQSELLYGVRRLPESRRRYRLEAALGSLSARFWRGGSWRSARARLPPTPTSGSHGNARGIRSPRKTG
jgi:predicted nucleic acid-binding protein